MNTMNAYEFYNAVTVSWFCVAALVFISLFFITAPYGRHNRGGWGPKIGATTGWLIMEIPAVVTITFFYLMGDRLLNPAAIAFLLIWQTHYINRALIFPFRRRSPGAEMPLMIAFSGMFFNVVNGYLQGYWLFYLSPLKDASWLYDPRFIIGLLMFLTGLIVNHQSDNILFRLRKPGEKGYKIPQGGLYRWISSPNYFGELIEWCGWAILTWSLGGLAFAVWTAANLAPRAIKHHKWYRQTFPEYPAERKALIPYVL